MRSLVHRTMPRTGRHTTTARGLQPHDSYSADCGSTLSSTVGDRNLFKFALLGIPVCSRCLVRAARGGEPRHFVLAA